MLVKPREHYFTFEGRIDGVAYGLTPNGVVAGWWPYPTWSPSALFNLSNGQVRNWDAQFASLPDSVKQLWSDWVGFLTDRELCLLMSHYFSFRSPADAAKAGYVNAQKWRATTGQAQTDTPLNPDLVPSGDSLSVVSTNPMVVNWDRPSGTPDQDTYLGLFTHVTPSKPTTRVQNNKMGYTGFIQFSMNEDVDIQSLVDLNTQVYKGSYITMNLVAGALGSVPYAGFQFGQYKA